MTTNNDLGTRTLGEELWLWQRRQRSPAGNALGALGSGANIAQAAEMLGVGAQRLGAALTGHAPVREAEALLTRARERDGSIEPTLGELCRLARRREGATLLATASALRLTTVAYLRAEAGGDPRVIAWWHVAGYRFPAASVAASEAEIDVEPRTEEEAEVGADPL